MVYINCERTDADFQFALEKYPIDKLDVTRESFMIWRTMPTLMTGRHQNTLCDMNMPLAKADNINIVQRITGGVIIFTDSKGWQFSFIFKQSGRQRIEFDTYTKPILASLYSLGVGAQKSGRNDLTIRGRKFSVNTQYLRKDAMLYHGSLLFDTNIESLSMDNDKIISRGIQSMRQREINIAEHLSTLMTSLECRSTYYYSSYIISRTSL